MDKYRKMAKLTKIEKHTLYPPPQKKMLRNCLPGTCTRCESVNQIVNLNKDQSLNFDYMSNLEAEGFLLRIGIIDSMFPVLPESPQHVNSIFPSSLPLLILIASL